MKRSKQEDNAIQSVESGNAALSEKEHAARPCCEHLRELATSNGNRQAARTVTASNSGWPLKPRCRRKSPRIKECAVP